MKQIDEATSIFKSKYQATQACFIFDNARPCHKKCSVDSLHVKKINVGPGVKHPAMRTIYGMVKCRKCLLVRKGC